jgi:hypothetical protein
VTCECERKRLDGNGVCKICGGRADLSAEQIEDLELSLLSCLEHEERQHLVRVRGRKRPTPRT